MKRTSNSSWLAVLLRLWHRFPWRIAWLRRRHLRFGRYGEDIACRLLEAEGLDVLCRNFRNRHQEIDIVARDRQGTLCIVEVKTRRWHPGVSPAEAVNAEKQRLLVSAARKYVREARLEEVPLRFDIVEVFLSDFGNLLGTNHLHGAFRARGLRMAGNHGWLQARI